MKIRFSLWNFILMTDSYKLTHWKQYPKNLKYVYSYLEARGGVFAKTLAVGMQPYAQFLADVRITQADVEEAEQFAIAHFGAKDYFNRVGWEYIVNECEGKLPIQIEAVKEGSLVPVSNVLSTIINTRLECAWLTNDVETYYMKVWLPITVGTNSFYCKLDIAESLYKSNNKDLSGLPFKLHDFGYRGVSSEETARIAGMAHLVNFMGTDTVGAIVFANQHYDADICGYSVPASEHSVACSYGIDQEDKYFENMLNQFPTGLVSVVSDTYNVFEFVKTMSTKYKDKILSRPGTVVFRPDSGDPIEVDLKLLNILWDVFGEYGTINEDGYKLLPSQVRLIQGDGIDREMLNKILDTLIANKFSADNIVFGSGGGLLQKFDRDTCKFAIKASYGVFEDECGNDYIVDLVKDPITSKGKRSKAGQLKLVKDGDSFKTISSKGMSKEDFYAYKDELQTILLDGETKNFQTFDEVRATANSYFEIELNKRLIEKGIL